MNRWLSALAVLVIGSASYADEGADLVLRHGRIVDGTGNPWKAGDVAVRDGRIVGIGHLPQWKGKREIVVRGLVVAPGFVDIHSHSDFTLLEEGRGFSKILQGVTTEVLGESNSPGPYLAKFTPPSVNVRGKPTRWQTLGEYFDLVEKAKISPNVASFVGLGNIWKCVMGESHARPTPAQFEEMKSLVDQAMREGARGMSCMLAVPPDGLATTDELVELCKVVAKHGGIFVAHIRHEGTEVFAAIREVIEIARRAGIAVEILHIKIADQALWGKMPEIVRLIDEARRQGLDIGANAYPYTRGNNNLATIIPPWAHEGGNGKMLERLKNPKDRKAIKRDIQKGIPGWYNHYTAVGGDWSRMLVSAENRYKGLTVDRILSERAKARGTPQEPLDEFFDLLIDEGGSISTVYDHHTEKDMNLALIQPWCGVGSDGYALAVEGELRRGNPHPRSFGTFPRVLGLYVRERKLLSLEEAVRRMTSLNAAKIGLTDRGILRPGMVADITVFDADRIRDRATYDAPFQYAEGVEYVLVNGELVLDRGKHTGALPGKALRQGK
jgi:N-acyl-D-amino-acid deacylase